MTKNCQANIRSRHWKQYLYSLGYIFVLGLLISACTVKDKISLDCDEIITDPQGLRNDILTDPIIDQLNQNLTLIQIDLPNCFANQEANISLTYEFPKSYSQYSLTYTYQLSLTYNKTAGTLKLIAEPITFEAEAIQAFFREKIRQLENNSRVHEFLTSIALDPQQPILLNEPLTIWSKNSRGDVKYSSGLVVGYLLPNDRIWQEFPEISQAQKIIEENLLVRDLSNCRIGRNDAHSYTVGDLYNNTSGPWYIRVAIICPDGLEEAYLKLNTDNSYEDLRIENKHK